MVIIKIEDNEELDIEITEKNITESENLFAESILRHIIDKLINK